MPATLIQRISESLAAGALQPATDVLAYPKVETIADLVRPWKELYPDVAVVGDDDELDTRSLFSWDDGLRHPKAVPQVRRSKRPIAPPAFPAAPPKAASPGLFGSVKAIWEYYQVKGQAKDELLSLPITAESLQRFTDDLQTDLSDYYTLVVHLEYLDFTDIYDSNGLCLMLPHETYEDEGSQALEAFLSGPDSVESLMSSLYRSTSNGFELPEEDKILIEKAGLGEIVKAFYDYEGKKSVDLNLFAYDNWYENFFGAVEKLHPKQMERAWPIISGNGGQDADLWIRSANDIYFALHYSEAYYTMMYQLPSPYDFVYNDCGVAEELLHEMCNVWRKSKRKRTVKWATPKRNTLSQQFKEGRL